VQDVVVVDAFTTEPFRGNPAAVCILTRPAPEPWMRLVAREMNLAETAFLTPGESTDADFALRWFTPVSEVELCGHATIASAHVLFEDGRVLPDKTIRFDTLSGILGARLDGTAVILDFPATPPKRADPPAGLATALGAEPMWVGQTPFAYLVELESEETVRGLHPDLVWISALQGNGLIVTAGAYGGPYDFVSRFFAPALGVPEDPVTGSAHCGLAAYWSGRLGKTRLCGYQASQRGGEVGVTLAGDRVELAGGAVTILRGQLLH